MSNRRLTYQYVLDFVKDNSECTLISDTYVNNSTKMSFKCRCGNIFETTFNNFKFRNKRQCNKCGNEILAKQKRLPCSELKNLVENIYGNQKLKLLTQNYKNANTKLDMLDEEGYKYQTTLSNLYYFIENNRELAKFSKSNKYTIDNIKIWMKDNARGYKILSSKYNGNRNKLKFECDNNHAFETTWVSFFNNGSRCPYCRSSRGEVKIRYYLEDSNIDFEEEYIFDDCKNIRPLPFDFAIFDNGRLELLIEFDGEQHFRAMSNFGGKEAFVYLQGNDEIKNSYCKKNNIELLRIPFKKIDSIEDILANKLNDIGICIPNQQSA